MIATNYGKARNKCRYSHLLSLSLLIAVVRLSLAQSSISSCDQICPEGFILLEETCECRPLERQTPHCPEGSVLFNEKCRKIVCPNGEYYKGLCLQALCPPGLVWRGKKCQEPGYFTTVLEIENVLTNEIREKPVYLEKSGTNEIVHLTTTPNPHSKNRTRHTTTKPYHDQPTAENKSCGPSNLTIGCCKVRTPRICKRYGQKWICFNRSQSLCDARVCTAPIVYLKPPEIKYSHPILIMPPNHMPSDPARDNNNVADCSGCATNHPENCSPYCYLYMCPSGTCNFMQLDLYCSYYPGQFGCIKEDGCLWNWC